MARAPNPKIMEAKSLYKKGLKLIEIANKLSVPAGTVRRWKHQYNWDGKCSHFKNERSDNKKTIRKNVQKEEVNKILEDIDLTDKQKLFCIYYIKIFNATKAYQKAYKCKYETAAVNGSRLLKNTKIVKEISDLKRNKLNRAFISEEDIFQKYVDIAFSDITDFIDFGNKEINLVDKDGKSATTEISYTTIKNSDEVDGALIGEISNSSKGVKIKLQDKMKALHWLSEHMDLATQEQRIRFEKLKAEKELLVIKNRKEEEEW
ncbi:MAG: terminase small subunit [Clostridium sp.]